MKRMAIEGLFSKLCKQGLIRHQPLKPTDWQHDRWFFLMWGWLHQVLGWSEANWPLWWVDLPKCLDQILRNTFCPVWVLGTKSFCKGAHFFPVKLHHFNYPSETTPLTQYQMNHPKVYITQVHHFWRLPSRFYSITKARCHMMSCRHAQVTLIIFWSFNVFPISI